MTETAEKDILLTLRHVEYLQYLERMPTMRDQFATALLHGNMQFFSDCDCCAFDEIAHDCYAMADAMLKEREK